MNQKTGHPKAPPAILAAMGKLAIIFIAAIIAITLTIATGSVQSTVKCPYPACKKSVAKTATSCKHCKKKFVTCQKCKRPNAADSKFCIYGCGKLAAPVQLIQIEVCSESDNRANEYCPTRKSRSIEKGTNVPLCSLHRKVETVQVVVCTESSLVAADYCPERTPRAFVAGNQPTGSCAMHLYPAVLRLTNNASFDDSPSWGPDGRIAFGSIRDGNSEIYIMNADGSNVNRLTNNALADYSPSWGPDGRIAFVSDRDGNDGIYVMNADGSNLKRLTNNASYYWSPSWGPDGRIAFVSNRDGNWEIYVMNADGSNVKRLTNNASDDDAPSWGPDGRIAFRSNRDGNWEIYTLQAPPKK